MAGLSVGSLLAMAYVDYATGFEVVFSAAYLLPVVLCAWHFGRGAVWAMALASGAAGWLVDWGHPYSHPLIEIGNAFMCFVVTLVVGLVLHALRHTLRERQQTNERLQAALERVQQSTAEILRLQNGLQVICSWTNRVKVGEQWMSAEEFLTTQLHLKISHGISPEASDTWLAARRKLPGSELDPGL